MRRILAAAVASVMVLLLAGFPSCQRRDTAPVADADPSCYRAAVPSIDPPDTGVRWTCDAETAECWDDLGNRVVPELAGRLLAAERSRQACAGFINDLKRRGVIVAPVQE